MLTIYIFPVFIHYYNHRKFFCCNMGQDIEKLVQEYACIKLHLAFNTN